MAGRTPVGAIRARRRRRRRLLVVAAAGGVAAVLVLVGAATMPASGRTLLMTLLTREPVSLVPNRVVVAPFEMRDGDSSSIYLGELAADWLTEGMAELPNVEAVDARTVMFTSRILARIPRPLRRDPARALAEETGAAVLVSGTIYRVGDSLLVQARVVDAATGRVERSVEPTSGAAAEPSGLLVRLRERVVAAVAAHMEPDARGLALGSTTPPSYEAYREMVLGWTQVMTRGGPGAHAHFQRAAALDSNFVTPLLSSAYLHAYVDDRRAADSLLGRIEPRAATLSHADRALLAHVRAMVHGDPAEQVQTALEWVARSPGSFEVPVAAAMTAAFHMRPRLALQLLARADPDRGLNLVSDLHCSTRALAHAELGDAERQLSVARECLRRFPAGSEIWKHRVVALATLGRVEELRRAIDEAPRRLRGGLTPLRLRRWAVAELEAHGHYTASRDLARETLAKLPRMAEDTTTPYALLALGHMRYFADDWRGASATAARMVANDSVRLAGLALMGVLAARRGDRAAAEWAEAQAASEPDPFARGEALLTRSQVRAALGDRVEAVRLLQEALDTGQVRAMNLHALLGLNSLRDYPPFQALIRPDG